MPSKFTFVTLRAVQYSKNGWDKALRFWRDLKGFKQEMNVLSHCICFTFYLHPVKTFKNAWLERKLAARISFGNILPHD